MARYKYKYKVKRPKLSKKDRGRLLKRRFTGRGIRKKDIKKTKRKYGGIPRVPGILTGKRRGGRDSQSKLRNDIYRRLDGGTERTMYVSGPGRSRSRKSSDRDRDRGREPSYRMSDMDQQIYDFQQEREDMFAMYEQMMIEQARQAEEERKKMEAAMRAQAQNAYSASLQPSFQLQGAGTTPKLGAAQQFRRRTGSQFGTASPYTGLAKISSGMVNA